MKMSKKIARLGGIQFLNSLPIEYALDRQIITGPFQFTRLAPIELNRRVANKELDISPISSIALAKHTDQVTVIPDFSISSRSGVKSVVLFSQKPIDELMSVPIAFSGKGETTPALLRILCNFRYGYEPRITDRSTEAELLIGDEALEAIGLNRFQGWHQYDLAEIWNEWTNLDFVFAVWVVQKEFFATNEELFLNVYQTLLDSKKWGMEHIVEIIRESIVQLPISPDFLAAYFNYIQYELDDQCLKGLDHFYALAAELKILPRRVHVGELDHLHLKT